MVDRVGDQVAQHPLDPALVDLGDARRRGDQLELDTAAAGVNDSSLGMYVGAAPDGTIALTATAQQRVHLFSPSGCYLSSFGSNGTGDGQFLLPSGVAADPVTGDWLVFCAVRGVLQRFAPNGTYLGTIVKFPLYLAVLPSSGIKSVSDLVAKAKAEPGKVTYSSAGIGNSTHVAAEMFLSAVKLKLSHVPYKGSSAALPDQPLRTWVPATAYRL